MMNRNKKNTNSLLLLIGDLFYYPRNKSKIDAQSLFGGNDGQIFPDFISRDAAPEREASPVSVPDASRLNQWPCQIKLLPEQAPFFAGAKLLIAADCTAFAYANMHEDFMKGRVTLIGCPKPDAVDYSEKLTAIIRDNDIRSVTSVRMDVPCCGGLRRAAETAIRRSGKFIPRQVVTITRGGRVLD